MNSTDNSSFDAQLAELRGRIDSIDDKLVALLKERIGIVHEVGALKKKSAPGCPIRPGREAAQMRRIAKAFEGSEFPPAAAVTVWRMLISASLSVESNLSVSVYAPPADASCWWLAGSYFGPFTPMNRQPVAKRVLADLVDGKASVGILPAPRLDDPQPWWTDLAALQGKRPVIFARIPYLQETKALDEHALAIALISPEATGDDYSFYSLTVDDTVSMHRLQTSFANAKLEARWVGNVTSPAGKRQLLAEIRGFLPQGDAVFEKLATGLGSGLLQSVFLGSHAAPLSLNASSEVRNAQPANA